MSRIRLVIALLCSALLMGCSDDESNESIAFHVAISDIQAYSATATVVHNATNRDAYYGFAVEGTVTDVQAEIARYLANTDATKLAESVHYQRKSVFTIKGLSPQKTFTYIVFGMNDEGDIYGECAMAEFMTTESNITATEFPNWTIRYQGHTVYSNNDYSLIQVSVSGEVEERFFLATYTADFAQTFSRTEDLLAYAVNDFLNKTTSDDDYWLEASEVRTNGTNFYRYLTEGDYVSYAVGVNADGTPTGHYVTTGTYHVDKYPPTAEYANLLGDWLITDETNKLYLVSFSERVVNKSLAMTGWGNYREYPIVVAFNRSNGTLRITAQLVAEATTIDFSDGSQSGSLSIRGVYYNEENKLKAVTQSHTAAVATLSDSGDYQFTPGFTVTLSNDTKATDIGLAFVLNREGGGSTVFARMMYPFTMTKIE